MSKRKYTHIKAVEPQIISMRKAGMTRQEIADELGLSKLFCGKCGDMMVGICGTSKAGVTHHDYACRAQRKHQCKKQAVRQDWIEGIVLRHLIRLVRNMDLLEFIAENTYQYYLAQNTDTTYTKSLQKALDETERAINNLLRAIEAFFRSATGCNTRKNNEESAGKAL